MEVALALRPSEEASANTGVMGGVHMPIADGGPDRNALRASVIALLSDDDRDRIAGANLLELLAEAAK